MYIPLRDSQDETPAAYCGKCLGEIYHGEIVVFYDKEWICGDCFQSAIEKLLRENMPLLAAELQLDTKNI